MKPFREWKMRNLFTLFRHAAMRAPAMHEDASVRSVVQNLPTPALIAIADDDLADIARHAMDQTEGLLAGGILQIGMGSTDLEIEEGRFSARCDVRMTTPGSRLEVRFEGAIDHLGRVVVDGAHLISDTSLRRAA